MGVSRKQIVVAAVAGVVGIAVGALGTCAAVGSGLVDVDAPGFRQAFGSRGLDRDMAWPSEELGDVVPEPEFSSAPVSVSTNLGGASIVYEGVSIDDTNAYVDMLREKGFAVNQMAFAERDSYGYSARDGEDADDSSMITVVRERDGRLTIGYSVPPSQLRAAAQAEAQAAGGEATAAGATAAGNETAAVG